MKLGCSSWSYHADLRNGRIDLREWLRICAEELDVDGVELLDLHFESADPAYLRDLKKIAADLGLTIAGVGISHDFGPAYRRTDELQRVREWCDVAAYIGAPVARVFAGWLPLHAERDPGRVIQIWRKVFGEPMLDRRRIWSDAMYALRQCADYAAGRGVVLAVQNARENGIVRNAVDLARAVHDVGSPWLRVALDPADLAERTQFDMALPRVVMARARMRTVQDDGADAYTHWPEVLRAMRLGRYRGFVLIDYEGAEPPGTAVPRAARYLREVLNTLERQRLLMQASRDSTTASAVAEAAAIVAGAGGP